LIIEILSKYLNVPEEKLILVCGQNREIKFLKSINEMLSLSDIPLFHIKNEKDETFNFLFNLNN
jgi:hypothetical protein